MHRSSRRLPSSSRGNSSSSYTDHSITATTSGLHGLHLTETADADYLSVQQPYTTSSTSRRAPSYDSRSPYGSNLYSSASYHRSASPTSYADLPPTVNPSVLTSQDFSSYGSGTYDVGGSTAAEAPYLSAADMSYPYSRDQGATSYASPSAFTRSPAQTGKRDMFPPLTTFPPRSPCGLKHAGYSVPSTEPSLSRSMSGPLIPGMLPSSTYEEVRNIGREFIARQQRRLNRPRRERKINYRQTLLPSNTSAGSSQAEDVNGSIDSFAAAVSTSTYESMSYVNNPLGYPAMSRAPYDTNPYAAYSSPNTLPYSIDPPRGNTTYTAYPASRAPSVPEPSSRDTQTKPQCWDHGCNGRQFSTFSNLLRHQREKSGSSTKAVCHRCGAEFTRKTARDGHLLHDKCKAKSPLRRP